MARVFFRDGIRGVTWYLDYTSQSGKRIRESLGAISKGEAEAFLKNKEREIRRYRVSRILELPDLARPTFEALHEIYLDWHEQHHTSASTARIAGIFRNHYIPFFGHTPLDDISPRMGEKYKESRLAANPKTATLNKEITQLKAYINWCVSHEYTKRNRLRSLRTKKVADSRPPRWFTSEELALLYRHSKILAGDEAKKGRPVNSPIDDYAPVWRLMANTGLRRTEALTLKWQNVIGNSVRILSSEGERTKSGKWRQVPISEGAREALDTLARNKRKADKYVLPRIRPEALSKAFARSVKRAELDGSLHCLRHTFAASLVMQGVDIYTIQKLLGHQSIGVTQKYAHLAPGYLQDAVKDLHL